MMFDLLIQLVIIFLAINFLLNVFNWIMYVINRRLGRKAIEADIRLAEENNKLKEVELKLKEAELELYITEHSKEMSEKAELN